MEMLDNIIAALWIAFLIAMLIWLILSLIRNDNTFKNQMIISNAINLYQVDMIALRNYDFEVVFEDMESYEDTYKRWLDWGYEHILPPAKYEIVKPYIAAAITQYKRRKK